MSLEITASDFKNPQICDDQNTRSKEDNCMQHANFIKNMIIFILFHSMYFEILCLLFFFAPEKVIKLSLNFSYILFIRIKGLKFSK